MSCLTARDRLISLFKELIAERNTSGAGAEKTAELFVPLKNNELAEVIAVTPEHLSRLLKELEHEGIIRRDKRMLTVRINIIAKTKICEAISEAVH